MKSIKSVNSDMKDLQDKLKTCTSKSEINRISRKIEQLRILKYYLETSPTEQFIKKQVDEITRKIDALDTRYGSWTIGRSADECNRNKYNAESGINYLKQQLKTLKYLLC